MNYITETEKHDHKPTAVTIGNFDGLHLGHMDLLKVLDQEAAKRSLQRLVMSFQPHPIAVTQGICFPTILTADEKKYLFQTMPVDWYLEYQFTLDFAGQSAERFIKEFLWDRLCCELLVLGEGYKLGRRRSADEKEIISICKDFGIEVVIVPHTNKFGLKISSSEIRTAIRKSEFAKCAEMMGRPYFVSGIVASGKRIGRTIDVPTANIVIEDDKLIPQFGVYATETVVDGMLYTSVSNICTEPNHNQKVLLETHIIDFNKDIYGKLIEVRFNRRIRDLMKFNNLADLKAQILNDIDESINIH